MKLISFLSIVILVVACNPYKQASRNAYNNTVVEVFPEVQFDSTVANNMLVYGNTNIEGVLFARRDATEVSIGNKNRVYASGALVTLFPVTPYFEAWYKLRKKKQRRLKRVYMSNEAFRKRITTTTDAYGRFVFDRMKPGKYFIMANISWTDYKNANVEVGRESIQTGTVYSTGGGVTSAAPIYSTTIYTQNMTFASDNNVNIEKFVTVTKTSGTVKVKLKGVVRN